jgi:7-cyano-7-deazaguanine reductase
MLLGRHTPVVQEYSPHLLYAIPRATARLELGLSEPLPFHGVDLWHAYEMSWMDHTGKPTVWVGRFSVPATSTNLVESKSFKLYLNSLNSTRFPSDEAARATIVSDISCAAGAAVTLELFPVGATALAGISLPGACLDSLSVAPWAGEPTAAQLQISPERTVEEVVYSHLLRSLCPVTGQPDWATVWLHYRGAAIERSSLLQYIVAYREHQEFHEQCVERMFRDIALRCAPEFLHMQAFYTRRGGLDINPFRSTDVNARPLPRLDRQ